MEKLQNSFLKNSEIPWRDIAGMRDVLIHDYIRVDMWAVWSTVAEYVPKLKENIQIILNDKIVNPSPLLVSSQTKASKIILFVKTQTKELEPCICGTTQKNKQEK